MYNWYTYRLRGCSMGCQPNDFVIVGTQKGFKYEVIAYNRELTPKEVYEYELVFLGKGDCNGNFELQEVM